MPEISTFFLINIPITPNIMYEIIELYFETDIAIQIALNNDIDDLPGFIIGGKFVFKGNDYTEDRIIEGIKQSWKQKQ